MSRESLTFTRIRRALARIGDAREIVHRLRLGVLSEDFAGIAHRRHLLILVPVAAHLPQGGPKLRPREEQNTVGSNERVRPVWWGWSGRAIHRQ